MLRQTLTKYKTIMLGNGKGSIYDFGCYLVSLVEGLNTKGWNFTVEEFNDILKEKNCWVGEFENYIDVDNIAKKYPEVFKSFYKTDEWPSTEQLNTWINGNFVVVCKVNAAGIGGTGTHFVVLKGWNGKVATVGDPWFGTIDPVTLHYGKLGNILSLRVFEINLKEENIMTDLYRYLDIQNDTDAEKKLAEHLGEKTKDGKKACNWGETGDMGGYLGSERKNNSKLLIDIDLLKKQSVAKDETLNAMSSDLSKVRQELSDEIKVRKTAQETLLTTSVKLSECELILGFIKNVGKTNYGMTDSDFLTEEAYFKALERLSAAGNISNLKTIDIFREIWRRILSSLDAQRK